MIPMEKKIVFDVDLTRAILNKFRAIQTQKLLIRSNTISLQALLQIESIFLSNISEQKIY